MNKITIIDYGMGNLRSIQKAFERLRVQTNISSNNDEILKANKLVLPGVGHFESGIKNLRTSGLINVLNEMVLRDKTPILGICLGMQLMTDFSEEGNCEGLGWINGTCQKFVFQNREIKVPHMGWNNLSINNKETLFKGISQDNFFYFVHSYHVNCKNEVEILTKTTYGNKFVSSFQKENIFGCQFHPEKSHDAGLKVLLNFANL
jgi:glutamine amidotransferase